MSYRIKMRILRHVKEIIGNPNNHRYICYALSDAKKVFPYYMDEINQIWRYIREQLDGCATLDVWNHYRVCNDKNSRSDRIQWLDWMIQCYAELIEESENVKST